MPTFYDVDLRRASMREFAFGTPWYRLPLIALMKLFQASIPASTDDPPAESLQPVGDDDRAVPDANQNRGSYCRLARFRRADQGRGFVCGQVAAPTAARAMGCEELARLVGRSGCVGKHCSIASCVAVLMEVIREGWRQLSLQGGCE